MMKSIYFIIGVCGLCLMSIGAFAADNGTDVVLAESETITSEPTLSPAQQLEKQMLERREQRLSAKRQKRHTGRNRSSSGSSYASTSSGLTSSANTSGSSGKSQSATTSRSSGSLKSSGVPSLTQGMFVK
jgi:hypothetical protein